MVQGQADARAAAVAGARAATVAAALPPSLAAPGTPVGALLFQRRRPACSFSPKKAGAVCCLPQLKLPSPAQVCLLLFVWLALRAGCTGLQRTDLQVFQLVSDEGLRALSVGCPCLHHTYVANYQLVSCQLHLGC